jgi:hypothetical protein
LGSLGVVDDVEFSRRLAERVIRVLIPKLFRLVLSNNPACLAAADRCEIEGTKEAAEVAQTAAWAARAAGEAAAGEAAAWAADAAAGAARAAGEARAAGAADYNDEYLILAANLALETLRALNSPGITLLGGGQ